MTELNLTEELQGGEAEEGSGLNGTEFQFGNMKVLEMDGSES